MENTDLSTIKLKNAVNSILFRNSSLNPLSRQSLNHKLKKLILSNNQLNNRFMNFNFKKEYKNMYKSMLRFNSEQNYRKNLITKLSKENKFFTRSYPNVISSLAIKIGNKKINYHTISIFTQKMDPSSSTFKENNFFFEDPLLLKKGKDLNQFYIHEKIFDPDIDESLNYSKKLLLNLNYNFHLNKVMKTIENSKRKMVNKTSGNIYSMSENNTLEINTNNTNNIKTENQSLSDDIKTNYRNRFNISNDINKNELEEIEKLKKYNKSIKKMLKTNYIRTQTFKNRNVLKLYDNNIIFNLRKSIDNNNFKRNRFNSIIATGNLLNKKQMKNLGNKSMKNNLFKLNYDLEKYFPANNKKQKSIKKKLIKLKKVKGSIQIKNIYKDLAKTKETINEYEKEKEPKFKILYNLFSKKKNFPFKKAEKENAKIKKLDRDLFKTVNEFHIN